MIHNTYFLHKLHARFFSKRQLLKLQRNNSGMTELAKSTDVLRSFFQLTHAVVYRALSGILIRLLHQTLEGFLHFGSSSQTRRVIRCGDRYTVFCTHSGRRPLFSHDVLIDGFHNKARRHRFLTSSEPSQSVAL